MRYLVVLITLCNLFACSNPGYSTRIYISSDARANENDINLITNIPKGKGADVILKKGRLNWKVESYRINLIEKRFDALERKYIYFVVEYYYNASLSKRDNTLEKIEVRIGNSRKGRNPILKLEIDKITDQVLSLLIKRFDKSYISIERKDVSPM
jgi:hypothetical protein